MYSTDQVERCQLITLFCSPNKQPIGKKISLSDVVFRQDKICLLCLLFNDKAGHKPSEEDSGEL